MSGPAFEIVYRNNLWRISLSEYQREVRVSVWAHYRDNQTGEWKPCGGKREAPGFIIPPERHEELEAVLLAMGALLRSRAAA